MQLKNGELTLPFGARSFRCQCKVKLVLCQTKYRTSLCRRIWNRHNARKARLRRKLEVCSMSLQFHIA